MDITRAELDDGTVELALRDCTVDIYPEGDVLAYDGSEATRVPAALAYALAVEILRQRGLDVDAIVADLTNQEPKP